jgi:hypothetical protein
MDHEHNLRAPQQPSVSLDHLRAFRKPAVQCRNDKSSRASLLVNWLDIFRRGRGHEHGRDRIMLDEPALRGYSMGPIGPVRN